MGANPVKYGNYNFIKYTTGKKCWVKGVVGMKVGLVRTFDSSGCLFTLSLH